MVGGGTAVTQERVSRLDTLVVCDAGQKKCNEIEALLKERKQIKLTTTVPIHLALEKARLLSPKLIWLELSPDPDKSLSLLAELREKIPQAKIFVSHDVADAKLIQASYRLGAADFLDADHPVVTLLVYLCAVSEPALLLLWVLPMVLGTSCLVLLYLN
jgi:DNA-binding NarL/FixJ family response regulator